MSVVENISMQCLDSMNHLIKTLEAGMSVVEEVSYMFYEANSFNQELGKWDVSNGSDFKHMFEWSRF